jgi:hypothetical protein
LVGFFEVNTLHIIHKKAPPPLVGHLFSALFSHTDRSFFPFTAYSNSLKRRFFKLRAQNLRRLCRWKQCPCTAVRSSSKQQKKHQDSPGRLPVSHPALPQGCYPHNPYTPRQEKAVFKGSEAGMTAFYCGCCEKPSGDAGEWGPVTQAAVT